MWRSASCSRPAARLLACLGIALVAVPGTDRGAERTSVAEALERAFPPPALATRQTLYLDAARAAAVEKLAGSELPSRIVTCYEARASAAPQAPVIGWACLDTHVVRTLPETLFVAVDADGVVRNVDVLAFKEPLDYLLSGHWFEQLEGRPLDGELALKRGIRVMSGATLSSRAATRATRRVLALVELELARREDRENNG